MSVKRAAAYLLLFAVVAAIPVVSQAQLCPNKYRHTTYYGYDHGSGPRCNAVVYPPGNPIIVGERIQHCDGSLTQWGLVCFDVTPDIYVENCWDCERDPDDIAVKDAELLKSPHAFESVCPIE
jgi:hypothetical protein